MTDHKLLSIYLNDHLAGATAGRDLARRARGSNEGTEFGAFLEQLAQDIDQDRRTLLGLMKSLDISEDRLKQAGAWAVEKAGRLKLNGSLTGYSPLSRVVELEGLALGVSGKLALWRALDRVSSHDERLSQIGLPELIRRAERQREGLERHRLNAVERALADGD